MPFRSEKQRRLCWVEHSRAIREGRRPKWDCEKFEKETKNKNLPLYRSRRRRRSSGSRKLTPIKRMSRRKRRSMHDVISRSRKIRTGPRGGQYIITKGKKVYV
jgi:hypothetical protein